MTVVITVEQMFVQIVENLKEKDPVVEIVSGMGHVTARIARIHLPVN